MALKKKFKIVIFVIFGIMTKKTIGNVYLLALVRKNICSNKKSRVIYHFLEYDHDLTTFGVFFPRATLKFSAQFSH